MKNNGKNFKCKQINPDSTKFIITNSVVPKWNASHFSVVQCNTTELKFKLCLHLLTLDIQQGKNAVLVAV